MIKIGTKLPATKQKSDKLLKTLSKRVVTKRDRKRGDATHGYAVEWKWACSVCKKEYENQSDAEMCCAEKKDATGRPWLRKLPYGLKLGATTYWIEDGKEYWSGDFDHCKFEDLLHNAKILRKLFKQHAKQFASSKPWACLKDYDKGVYVNCEKLVKNTPIQVAATKICEHSLAVWKKYDPSYKDKRIFEETSPEQIKDTLIQGKKRTVVKCDICKWGKDSDLVKHGCWECGAPDWKHFEADWRLLFEKWDALSQGKKRTIVDQFIEQSNNLKSEDKLMSLFKQEPYAEKLYYKLWPHRALEKALEKVEVSHKPEKKPWAFMKCRKCGESIPCFNDTPFATCQKCGAVFAQKASKPVKVEDGQPKGFYPNRALVDLNKGWEAGLNKGGLTPEQREQNTPIFIVCWNNECDKRMAVCGHPWYICDNDHIINVLTGDKWNWKATDEIYHGLLVVLQGQIEPAYQKLFFPNSKLREHTETDTLSTTLTEIGEHLYVEMQPIEPDPYHWGPDKREIEEAIEKDKKEKTNEHFHEFHAKRTSLSHHGGLRFAINLMSQTIKTRKHIVLPSEDMAIPNDPERGYKDKELNKAWKEHGWQAVYEYDSVQLRKLYGDVRIKEMLLTIDGNIPRPQRPPKQTKLVDKSAKEKTFRRCGVSELVGSPLGLAIRLKLEMECQLVGDNEPILRVKKSDSNKQLFKAYINKTLKASKLFTKTQQIEITERIFAWSWRLTDPVEEAEAHLKHEIGVAKHPLSKKTALEILRLMRMGHPNEHGEVYSRFDVMDECSRRRKQLLMDLKWPIKPDSYYYSLYNGEKEILSQICGEDKWEPLGRASHELAVKLSEATNNEYDHETLGLSCSTLKYWQNLITKYPKAQPILREAVRLDKAFYEYKIHKGALLSALKLGDAQCEHNIIMIAKWLGVDVTKLEPLDSIPKTDIYASVWKILEHYQPQPLTMPQKIENVRKQATSKKPAQAALTDFFK